MLLIYRHASRDSEDGKRVTHNISARVPGFGVQSICFSTEKANLKKKVTKVLKNVLALPILIFTHIINLKLHFNIAINFLVQNSQTSIFKPNF